MAFAEVLVVAPSAAKPPEWKLFDSTARPAEVVHADRSAVSKPSAKIGAAAAGVVTETGALRAETFPEASRARTAYVCVLPARTVLSV